VSTPDLAHIRAATEEIINDGEALLNLLAEVGTQTAPLVGQLADLSAPAAEAAALAQAQTDPAVGSLLDSLNSLRSYAATLSTTH